MKIKQISPQEHIFLQRLEYIALTPKILYYYGTLPGSASLTPFGAPLTLDSSGCPRSVAIVGSRKMTPYGQEIAYRAAYELARRGIIIISGLALGIDATAHRGALDAGGLTIGILGTSIDRFYPKPNESLSREIIAKNGAILSEYPPSGTIEISGREFHPNSKSTARVAFLHRNRLISGLADAVIVVEADERSGSLNTASHALDQGKLLFSVPGDLSRPTSRGCNSLFGKGALAYTSPDDVLDELFIPRRRSTSHAHSSDPTATPAEQTILAALEQGIKDGEQILAWSQTPSPLPSLTSKSKPSSSPPQLTPLTPATFNQAITLLELKGRVKRLLANQWMLK